MAEREKGRGMERNKTQEQGIVYNNNNYCYHLDTRCMRKFFFLDKNFTKPSYLHIAEKIRGKNFSLSIIYAIFNAGQKLGL